MDKLVIRGGNRLSGEVSASGAKNAVLPLMTSAILASGRSSFSNVPDLKDVRTMGRLLEHMGAAVSFGNGTLDVDTSAMNAFDAPYDLVRTMRASVLVLGPLVARMGSARVSLPGGCAIGARPINLHLKGLEKMGAKIVLEGGYVHASVNGRLRGARITFDIPTVTGTENLMMAAALADGDTVIENAACEPEVSDLADALIKMGAKISGAGTPKVRIAGVENLAPVSHAVIPDRIETGTFMVAAGITGGDIFIRGGRLDHLEAVAEKLREIGIVVAEAPGGVRAWANGGLNAVDIKTMPFPGFPTDMQAQLMAFLSVVSGTSVITESIFENRYMHVAELDRLGADIRVDGSVAKVRGVPSLKGADVMATDLRASASLVLAGLVADGVTTVHRIYHLDRGYDGIEKKLTALGADIRRERD